MRVAHKATLLETLVQGTLGGGVTELASGSFVGHSLRPVHKVDRKLPSELVRGDGIFPGEPPLTLVGIKKKSKFMEDVLYCEVSTSENL